jgi:hypothetical protein
MRTRQELLERADDCSGSMVGYSILAIAMAINEWVDNELPGPGWVEVTTSQDLPARVFLPTARGTDE